MEFKIVRAIHLSRMAFSGSFLSSKQSEVIDALQVKGTVYPLSLFWHDQSGEDENFTNNKKNNGVVLQKLETCP